jgi:hypothetical protein
LPAVFIFPSLMLSGKRFQIYAKDLYLYCCLSKPHNDVKMLQENEIVMLLLGIGVFSFFILNKAQIRKITSWKILFGSYCFLLSGWVLTVLEGFFLAYYLNLFEHICYAVSTVMVVVWCWKSLFSLKEEEVQ